MDKETHRKTLQKYYETKKNELRVKHRTGAHNQVKHQQQDRGELRTKTETKAHGNVNKTHEAG